MKIALPALWFATSEKIACGVAPTIVSSKATNVCNQANLKACDSSMVCVGATKNIGSKRYGMKIITGSYGSLKQSDETYLWCCPNNRFIKSDERL